MKDFIDDDAFEIGCASEIVAGRSSGARRSSDVVFPLENKI